MLQAPTLDDPRWEKYKYGFSLLKPGDWIINEENETPLLVGHVNMHGYSSISWEDPTPTILKVLHTKEEIQ